MMSGEPELLLVTGKHRIDNSPDQSDLDFLTSSEPLTKNNETSSPARSTEMSSQAITSSPLRQVLNNWRLGVVLLTPLLLLPIITEIPDSLISKCAYILLLMAIYWCTEALPLAATALIPLFLAPMIGLMSSKAIAVNYLTDLNFLFVGGLMFATAIEKWNLHKRIALRVLIIVGTKPKMLLLGFIIVTGFLSMWLSNTATTAMMIPIAHAVIVEMWKQKKAKNAAVNGYELKPNGQSDNVEEVHIEDKGPDNDNISPEDMSPKFQNLGKAVSLCVCYAANIGGIGTLTGTGPNLIIGQIMNEYFPDSDDVTFGSWMLFATPLMVVCLAICWVILVLIFLGPRTLFCCYNDPHFETEGGKIVLRREYNKLGKTSFPEIVLIIFFGILVLLWLFRDPKFMPGWSILFLNGYVSDASTGIFICTFLFTFPSSFPCLSTHTTGYTLGPPILDWNTVQKKLPWGVIILLGGGFALAAMCKDSGLSDWLGCQLAVLDSIPPSALVFTCGTVMTLFTEFTSNASSASIFLPILAQLAVTLEIHPLYILAPVTVCSSFAFAFPVATPPNAIVFAFGHLRVIDMVKSGMLMNLLCLSVAMLAINTWGAALFKLNTFPSWAATGANSTCT
ncbi:Na(+)/citrate cotransporter-like isoform X1 [Watersipora subatra]|uniref:Na(+)/citrate cotransporter-like isoform X1 n=1 Tax=Watersipora subatra TaxID=2589382 RepID=UPI00355B1886